MSYSRVFVIGIFVFFCLFPIRVYADGTVVINEFLPHPSSDTKEWVELYVPDTTDITKYWIDDDTDFSNDAGSSGKKQLTSAAQGSDVHHVVFELSSSIFNNDGDTIALFTPDGVLIDQYHYTNDPGTDVSIGRSPDGTGDFSMLSSATKGSTNTSIKPPDTATPAPTDKPTTTPKPTSTPKPEKSPTATPTIRMNQTTLADTKVPTVTKKTMSTTTKSKTSSISARPTSILGISTKSAEKKIKSFPTQPILVKGATSTAPQVVAVIAGGIFLLAGGIIMYIKKRKARLR
jgi:Lamin Tail Domain